MSESEPHRNEAPSPARESRLRSLAVLMALTVVWMLTLFAGVLSLAGFLARHAMVLDLVCHFRVQYAVALALAALTFAISRQGRRAIFAAVFASINLALIAPLYLPLDSSPQQDEHVGRLRILTANVLGTSSQFDALLKLVRDENPEVIVLSEITPRWIEELAELRPGYPHYREAPSPDNFGIALYSKLPLENVQVWQMGRAEIPAIVATVVHDAQRITINAVHVLPPSGRDNWIERNRALTELTNKLTTQQGSVVVAGDLNTTSWSPAFTDLVAATGLVDSRQGFGVQPTFPAESLLVRIPIDHCLISPSLHVIDRRVGPDIGSDHLPIVIDLAVPASTEEPAR